MSVGIESQAADLPRYPDLACKVAVITGGSRGIGAATARALAANGVDVAVVGRDEAALTAVANSIQAAGTRALPCRTDVTDEVEVQRLADTVSERLGAVDNPRCVRRRKRYARPHPTGERRSLARGARHRSHLDVPHVSAFLGVMLERRGGSIVTMSSSAGRQAARSNAAYAAAKAGVAAFTRHLANEIAASGVRVNCLAPSSIETERLRDWTTPEIRRQLAASFPLRRIGRAPDVAAAALFFASDAPSWISGVTLDVAAARSCSDPRSATSCSRDDPIGLSTARRPLTETSR
ncbi:MAG: SDR family oxidoreductase [Solirubrobacterales bacterium]|nr:SDR family oxidoreductase [Solirubrobacterales bacterium]